MGANMAILSLHNFVYSNFGILKPLEEGDFSAVSNWHVEGIFGHLDVGLGVKSNAFYNFLDNLRIKIAVLQSVFTGVENKGVLSENADD